MEIIQQSKFKAFDGKMFDDSDKCIKYEKMAKQVYEFLDTIENSDKYDSSFKNGKGYVQHPPNTYQLIEAKLIELSNIWFNPKDKFTNMCYYLGRLIDDSNMSCLNKLMYRLMCMDITNREFGQPYYALHSNDATLIQLNL
jgi:hypothetical protein